MRSDRPRLTVVVTQSMSQRPMGPWSITQRVNEVLPDVTETQVRCALEVLASQGTVTVARVTGGERISVARLEPTNDY